MATKTTTVYFKNLIKMLDCPTKSFLSETSLKTKASDRKLLSQGAKAYIKATILKEELTYSIETELGNEKITFDEPLTDIKTHCYSFLDKFCPDSIFLSKAHKKALLEHNAALVARFLTHPANSSFNLQKGISGTVSYKGIDINVKCDFISISEGCVELINIQKSKPTYYYSKKSKPENRVSSNLELLLLYMLGKTIYPDLHVCASIRCLEGKNDDYPSVFPEYESKQGENIMAHSFSKSDTFALEQLQLAISHQKKFSKKKLCDLEKKLEYSCKATCSYFAYCSQEKIPFVPMEEITVKKEKVAHGGSVTLTDAQTEAIMFNQGIARINAGAGSGKTTVVALRVVRLLKDGVDPSQILLVTFSNKGAQEMREKVAYWLDKFKLNIDVSKIKIATFNAWGAEIVNKNYSFLGFTKFPKLAEKVDIYDIILELLDQTEKIENLNYSNPLFDLPRSVKKGILPGLASAFSAIKSNLWVSEEEIASNFTAFEDNPAPILRLYKEFNKKLIQKNLLQHQDQLNLVLELMDFCPRIIPKYQHIMIDEFQDSDEIQLQIIHFLIKSPQFQSLMVVGDDDQSIYEFRNATPKNIIDFDKYFPNVQDVVLSDNFRSTPEIIELANTISHLNVNRIDKSLVSGLSHSGIHPSFKEYESETEELSQLISNISTDLKTVEPEEIAIIARTKDELIKLRNALANAGIPSVIDVSEIVSKDTALILFNQFGQFLLDHSYTQGYFSYLLLKDYDSTMLLSKAKLEKVFNKELPLFIEEFDKMDHLEQLDFFISTFKNLMVDNIAISLFIEHLETKGFGSIQQYISYLNKYVTYVDDTSFEVANKYKAVNLLTAHSSKGKEYKHVYLCLDRFKDPSSAESEELRRLLFVSITRAKQKLELICSKSNSKNYKQVKEDVVKAIMNGSLKSYA